VPGAAADLLLVEGDPFDDIGLLAASSNVLLVVKDVLLAKVGLAVCVCVCVPAAARVDAGGVCMRPGSDTDAQAVVYLTAVVPFGCRQLQGSPWAKRRPNLRHVARGVRARWLHSAVTSRALLRWLLGRRPRSPSCCSRCCRGSLPRAPQRRSCCGTAVFRA
jgi:hypothetical protein